MISYADQFLISDDPALLERVQAVLSLDDLRDFARTSWPGRTAAFGFPWQKRETKPVLNRLVWPTGASRCAMGWFLTDDAGLQVIRPGAYSGGVLTAQSFQMTDQAGGVIATNLYMLPPRPLGQCGTGLDLYLLTLVDQRYFLPDTAGALSISVGAASWSDLLTAIVDPIPILIDNVPAAYLTPTNDWNLPGFEDPAKLLAAAAAAVGMRVVFNLDGSIRVLSAASARLLAPANPRAGLTAGGFMDFTTDTNSDLAGILPPTVTIIDGSGAVHGVTLTSLAMPQYAGAKTGPANISPVLRTMLTGTDSQMTALANQMATDWYAWQAANVDAAFSGVSVWSPTGIEDRIEWTHHDHEISTRVQRAPWNVRTEYAAPFPARVYVRLTGNPGTSCNYLEGVLQVKTTVGGCVKYIDGPIVQVLDLNATSGSA
jgi:hypothetical protein